MPCRCDYMDPNAREEESSNVIKFLTEVGLFQGKHPGSYGDVDNLDNHTAKLCTFCERNIILEFSLELQIWWRDHQKADAKRIKTEREKGIRKTMRKSVLDKLTDEERDLLGL